MNVYILIINWNPDLIQESTSFEKLLDSNFKWVKLTDESYLIASKNSPVEIRDYITNKISNLRRIFVGEMKESAAWRSMLTDNEAIKQIFKNE